MGARRGNPNPDSGVMNEVSNETWLLLALLVSWIWILLRDLEKYRG